MWVTCHWSCRTTQLKKFLVCIFSFIIFRNFSYYFMNVIFALYAQTSLSRCLFSADNFKAVCTPDFYLGKTVRSLTNWAARGRVQKAVGRGIKPHNDHELNSVWLGHYFVFSFINSTFHSEESGGVISIIIIQFL